MGKRKQGEATEGTVTGIQRGWSNIIPVTERSPEEAKEIARRGAAAARAIKAKRKSIREIYDVLLQLPASDEMIQGTCADQRIQNVAVATAKEQGIDLSVYDAIALAQAVRAAKGDTGAAAFVRDSAGDKPTDKQQVDLLTPEDAAVTRKLAEKMGISVD